jgi:hypothetical protein
MAKRTRIIEGTWNCTSCDTKGIPARLKLCPTCNNPRELTGKESEFDFGEVDAKTGKSLREGVTDEETLRLAAAGEDWFCAYCGAANRGDVTQCQQCSAERTPDAKAAVGRELPPPGARPSRGAAPQPVAPPKKRMGKAGWLVLGALLSCCFGSSVFSYWGSRTHAYSGEVTRTAWKRTVVQERFVPVAKTAWKEDLRGTAPRMPVNGAGEVAGVTNIRDCVSRQRGTRRVADGTERVCRNKTRRVACGTEERCRRRDQGNGFVEEVCEDVTKYCNESYEDCQTETRYRTEPVYSRECTYDTYEWKPVDRREVSGTDDRPRWPELAVGAVDRLRREEQYSVHIRYEDDGEKEHVLEPQSEQEFLSWKKGQGVHLTVTNLGKVEQVVPR